MTTALSLLPMTDALEGSWHAAPVFSIKRSYQADDVTITTVGGDAAMAEDGADLLTQLLSDWDLADRDSLLSNLWRSAQPFPVDDRTLLLLTLATSAEVSLDAGTAFVSRTVELPDHNLLVALAIDMVIAELLSHGVLGACVQNAGQLRVTGTAPSGPDWLLTLEDPGPRSTVGLREGACATFTRTVSGNQIAESLVVFATTAWQATLLGLQAMRLPAEAAVAHLETLGLPARLRTQAGVLTSGDWASREDGRL